MATPATTTVLRELIESVAQPGDIHPALAYHVTTLLESYLSPPYPV
ncbi:hypothetical protein HQQ80_10530 [Microbacteriaceae bacterium VKM Ac-2855]|nr:hypothetical protein [Microbacteriaceae bacterium VKM Ac-2855]